MVVAFVGAAEPVADCSTADHDGQVAEKQPRVMVIGSAFRSARVWNGDQFIKAPTSEPPIRFARAACHSSDPGATRRS